MSEETKEAQSIIKEAEGKALDVLAKAEQSAMLMMSNAKGSRSSEQPPNSALDVKLDYIQKDISDIKKDVKDIKSDFVSRREFEGGLAAVREEIAPLKKFVYAIVTVIGLSVFGAILNLVLNK